MMLLLPVINLDCERVVVTRRETMSECYGAAQPVGDSHLL
jgi:hypothetical protein